MAFLREIFTAALQPPPVRERMSAPLELHVNSRHRLVLSTIGDGVLLEVVTPTNAKEGHGCDSQRVPKMVNTEKGIIA